MQRLPRRHGLAHQYTRWLAALFIALEIVTVAAVLIFVMLPRSERAADDLAGLMVLSARTWVELPPETRPVFEDELARGHQIALRPSMLTAPDSGLRHGFYIRLFARAFERRLGPEALFVREAAADGSDWLWIALPAADRSIGVGFAVSRLQTNPFAVLAAALATGTLFVGALVWWLASRIAQPVARFERAAAQLAKGAQPDLLPETGPRELADLAHHFNQMAVQLRELSDARTTLFAGLSHDLRTPLARMRLALEMLTLKPEPALASPCTCASAYSIGARRFRRTSWPPSSGRSIASKARRVRSQVASVWAWRSCSNSRKPTAGAPVSSGAKAVDLRPGLSCHSLPDRCRAPSGFVALG